MSDQSLLTELLKLRRNLLDGAEYFSALIGKYECPDCGKPFESAEYCCTCIKCGKIICHECLCEDSAGENWCKTCVELERQSHS